jgi:hypothetical protein
LDRSTVHHQESRHCVHSNRYLSCKLCWLSASKVRMEQCWDSLWWTVDLSETCRVIYQNKFEKKCILLAFIIRKYHDAQFSECQTLYCYICFFFCLLYNLYASFLFCLYNSLFCLEFLHNNFILASFFCPILIHSSSYQSSYLFLLSYPSTYSAVSEIHFFIWLLPALYLRTLPASLIFLLHLSKFWL